MLGSTGVGGQLTHLDVIRAESYSKPAKEDDAVHRQSSPSPMLFVPGHGLVIYHGGTPYKELQDGVKRLSHPKHGIRARSPPRSRADAAATKAFTIAAKQQQPRDTASAHSPPSSPRPRTTAKPTTPRDDFAALVPDPIIRVVRPPPPLTPGDLIAHLAKRTHRNATATTTTTCSHTKWRSTRELQPRPLAPPAPPPPPPAAPVTTTCDVSEPTDRQTYQPSTSSKPAAPRRTPSPASATSPTALRRSAQRPWSPSAAIAAAEEQLSSTATSPTPSSPAASSPATSPRSTTPHPPPPTSTPPPAAAAAAAATWAAQPARRYAAAPQAAQQPRTTYCGKPLDADGLPIKPTAADRLLEEVRLRNQAAAASPHAAAARRLYEERRQAKALAAAREVMKERIDARVGAHVPLLL